MITKKLKINKNLIIFGVLFLAIVAAGVLALLAGATLNPLLKSAYSMDSQAVAQQSIDYINSTILQGRTATLEGFSEESGVIKISIKIDNNTYDSYVSRDGKLLFPEGLRIDGTNAQGSDIQVNTEETQNEENANSNEAAPLQ